MVSRVSSEREYWGSYPNVECAVEPLAIAGAAVVLIAGEEPVSLELEAAVRGLGGV